MEILSRIDVELGRPRYGLEKPRILHYRPVLSGVQHVLLHQAVGGPLARRKMFLLFNALTK
jgi:hypothetical protein